ncbi:thioredoxin reductase glit [Trametes polyzona]|nr:thioredoxin reductase glit [Trametes polyzona]
MQRQPSDGVVDVLIVGAGPAGLGAALSLGRLLRTAVVFDSQEYRNAATEHAHNVPTHDHKPPAAIRGAMKEELLGKYKTVSFVDASVLRVREAEADGKKRFELDDSAGRTWTGRKLVLATGSRDVLPDIPGYKEAWGKVIFNCPLCDGFEEAGSEAAGVLLLSDAEGDIQLALALAHGVRALAKKVTLLTNGSPRVESHAMVAQARTRGYEVETRALKGVQLVRDGPKARVRVEFADGAKAEYAFLMDHPPTALRSGDLAAQLGLEMAPSGEVKITGVMQETSRHGVFAAGDCATVVKQVVVSMAAGVTAGAGAHFQMVQDDFEAGAW